MPAVGALMIGERAADMLDVEPRRIDLCDSSLLPLWEKVILAQRGSDEGYLTAGTAFAETDPSPVASLREVATISHKGRGEESARRWIPPTRRWRIPLVMKMISLLTSNRSDMPMKRAQRLLRF